MTDYYRSRFYGPYLLPTNQPNQVGRSWVVGNGTPVPIVGLPPSASPSQPGKDSTKDKEVLVKLRVTLCCDGCKEKLQKKLRRLEGVETVAIKGWNNAMVTVTGPAPSTKVLKEARKISNSAEIWKDSFKVDA